MSPTQGHDPRQRRILRLRTRASARVRGLGSFLALAAIVALVAFAISWPLWTLATRSRAIYTSLIGGLGLVALLFLVIRAAARRLARRRARVRAAFRVPEGGEAPPP